VIHGWGGLRDPVAMSRCSVEGSVVEERGRRGRVVGVLTAVGRGWLHSRR
jgi:hypothetical protein